MLNLFALMSVWAVKREGFIILTFNFLTRNTIGWIVI